MSRMCHAVVHNVLISFPSNCLRLCLFLRATFGALSSICFLDDSPKNAKSHSCGCYSFFIGQTASPLQFLLVDRTKFGFSSLPPQLVANAFVVLFLPFYRVLIVEAIFSSSQLSSFILDHFDFFLITLLTRKLRVSERRVHKMYIAKGLEFVLLLWNFVVLQIHERCFEQISLLVRTLPRVSVCTLMNTSVMPYA